MNGKHRSADASENTIKPPSVADKPKAQKAKADLKRDRPSKKNKASPAARRATAKSKAH
ncbi:hypothetical protein [Paraburkholderia hospita]|uniref:hypothetical protein n=1 Tax=Paraburkholderia hospita TaxID=169430 RepID=UPI00141EF0F0|nr:hypothetical protein [Paraburkholderia hospita]